MEKKKLPSKRHISFSKVNNDVNEFIENETLTNPNFNFSDYMCKLVRDDMLKKDFDVKLKETVKVAVVEALADINLNLTITKQDQRLDDEVLESSLSALDDL